MTRTQIWIVATVLTTACGPAVDEEPGQDASSSGSTTDPGSSTSSSTDTPEVTSSSSTGTTTATTTGSTTDPTTGSGSSTTDAVVCGSPLLDSDDRLELAGEPLRGDPDALVTIVAWMGYQDPFSHNAHGTMTTLLADPDLGPHLRFFVKQLPFEFHFYAEQLARASVASRDQGLHWELHDALMAHEGDFDDTTLDTIAQGVGLDLEALHETMESDAITEHLERDRDLFTTVGFTGTPSFMFNGAGITGAHPLGAFETMATEELEAIQQLIDGGRLPCEALTERLETNLGP